MDILFRTYLSVVDYEDELVTRQELLLSILRLAKELDVSFAFPSTSVYLEKSGAAEASGDGA